MGYLQVKLWYLNIQWHQNIYEKCTLSGRWSKCTWLKCSQTWWCCSAESSTDATRWSGRSGQCGHSLQFRLIPHVVIDQSIKFLQLQYPRCSQAQRPDSQIGVQTPKLIQQFHNINGLSGVQVSMGKGQVEKMHLETFPEDNSWGGWTGSVRFFQGKRAQEWKAPTPVLVLILGTDSVPFVWS